MRKAEEYREIGRRLMETVHRPDGQPDATADALASQPRRDPRALNPDTKDSRLRLLHETPAVTDAEMIAHLSKKPEELIV